MAEQVALARAVISVEGDATQLIAQMASAETAVNDFSKASKESIGKAVAALSGLGNEAAAEFDKLSSASKRAVTQLALQTGRLQVEAGKLSGDTFRQLELIVKGTSATIAEKYVGALSKAAAEAKNLATAQGAIVGSATAANTALAAYDANIRNARVSANQLRTAYAQLPAQITDVVTSLASGIPAYLVLIQQGGQIKDSFGGVGNALKALAGFITPTNVALAALAGTVGAVAFGFVQGQKEIDAYTKALILSGNQAGVTVEQLMRIATSVGAMSGASVSQAAAALAQFAASGKVAEANLELVTLAAVRLANVTGEKIGDVVKTFNELGKAPLDASIKLNETTNFLTRSLYEQIKALTDVGKTTEAAALAQTAYANEINRRAPEIEERIGSIEKAWNKVTAATVKVKDALLDIGRADPIAAQIADAEARLARGRQLLESGGGGERFAERQRAANQAIEAELAGLRDIQRLRNEEVQTAQQRKVQTEAAIELDKFRGKYIADEVKLRQDVLRIIQLSNAANQTGAQLQEDIALRVQEFLDSRKEGAKKTKEDVDQIQKSYEDLARTLNTDLIAATIALQVAQQDLTDDQAAYLKITQSPAWREYTDGQRQAITIFYEQIIPLRQAAKAIDDKKKSEVAARKATEDWLKTLAKENQSLEERNQALQEEIDRVGLTKEAIAQLTAAKLLNNAADADALALANEMAGAEQTLIDLYRERARLFREQAGKTVELAGKEAAEEARKANEKAAEDAYIKWRESIDDISKSLADGIIDGGKSAARALQDLFNRLVLRPIIQAALTPIVQGVAAAFGFANPAAAGTAGAGGTQTLQLISSLNGLRTTFQTFGGGVAASLGSAAVAAGNIFGSAVLSKFGTGLQGARLAAGLQGPTTAGAGGAIGAGAASAAAINAAAGIAAGVLAGRAISGGFSAFGQSGNRAVNVGTAAGAVIGSIIPVIGTAVGAALGGALGGLVNRAFGRRAAQVENRELVGTFQQGQFSGDVLTTLLEKGGWFRSDKRSQLLDAVTGDFDKALDEAGTTIINIVKKYGEALSLPVDELAKIPAEIRVKLTENAEDNQKAIEDALNQYAGILFESFADELEPLRKAGETIVETIERVGGAILTVNSVLENIGVAALKLSVDGGKAAFALVELFGGINEFSTATSEFYNRFFSETERLQNVTRQLNQVFGGLGVSIPTTKNQFRDLVEAQDLTTESGRQTFATLLSIAGVFDDVTTASEKAAIGLRDAIEAFRERFRTPEQSRRASISRIATQLIDQGALKGTVEEITNLLANASEESIFAAVESFIELSDASDETQTSIISLVNDLLDLREGFDSLSDDILQFLGELKFSDISPLSYKEQLDSAKELFEITLEGARKGDPAAMRNLLNNARGYLEEARDYYASSGAYVSIFNQVTSALAALGVKNAPAELATTAADSIEVIADAAANTAADAQEDPVVQATRDQTQTIDNFSDDVIDSSAAEVDALIQMRDLFDRKFNENIEAVKEQVNILKADVAERQLQQELQGEQIRIQTAEARVTAANIASIESSLSRLLQTAELASAAPT